MTAIRAAHAGDPRVSPDLSSHVERHLAGREHLRSYASDPHEGLFALFGGLRRAAGAVTEWPARSHRRSLRNAMLASTALVERRIELDEVEGFLRERDVVGRDSAGRA